MALEKNERLARAFGKHVRDIREAKGLSRQDVAYKLNIERKQFDLIEDGEINTSLQMAYALAAAFGMELGELLRFEVEG
jgi:ribosome-binding protein aMBF1 (putative translation factor)